MRRTVDCLHIVVIGRMLILVPDNETDRRAGCFSLVNTGKELNFVVFLAGSRNFGLSRFTAV